jgi:hypothetical protein
LLKDESLSICPESVCKETHIQQTVGADFPSPESRYEITSDMLAAIKTIAFSDGTKLALLRKPQVVQMRKLACSCAPLTADLYRKNKDVPANITQLRKGINLIFLAVLLEASGWGDVGNKEKNIPLCQGILRGFLVGGDLSEHDSYIHRPAQPMEASEKEAFKNKWDKFSSREESIRWLKECETKLSSTTTATVLRHIQHPPDPVDPTSDLALLRAVMAKTAEEVDNGLMDGGWTTAELVHQYPENGFND